ncbi:unnamed protein product [Mesocestoides corti]|uniref:Enkurin domain-containing protein n=1 Tax=Mesocestoides corti TaxID=53468 RepID=A0A3P6GT91_MESCO|nr:unnamed protein product [Mesocestoides corti]
MNYIRANANAVTYGQVRNQRPASEEDLKCENSRSSVTARSNLGKLPCYLIRRRKEEQAKKAELARSKNDREGSALTPPGHRRVSEDERTKTLAALHEAHANALSQLQGLPIHMSTTRVRNRQQELENRLSELEEAINIFRKPIVYIKLD